jgi:hypothetical protein
MKLEYLTKDPLRYQDQDIYVDGILIPGSTYEDWNGYEKGNKEHLVLFGGAITEKRLFGRNNRYLHFYIMHNGIRGDGPSVDHLRAQRLWQLRMSEGKRIDLCGKFHYVPKDKYQSHSWSFLKVEPLETNLNHRIILPWRDIVEPIKGGVM